MARQGRGGVVIGAGLVLGAASLAMAQDDQRRIERAVRQADGDWRIRVDPALSLAERSQLDVGGAFSFSVLNLNDRTDNHRRLVQYDTVVYARGNLDGVHSGFARVRFPFRDFSPGDSFDGRGDRWVEPFVDRYWYEFDLRRAKDVYEGQSVAYNFNLRVGRQFVDWGTGLTLSENLYAARPTVSWADGRAVVEALVGVTPPDESVVDFDASRDEYNRRTLRGFFGGRFVATGESGTQYYVYGLKMADYNNDTASRPALSVPVNFDYDATYFGLGTQGSLGGNLAYLGEVVWQTGHSMSDPIRGISGVPGTQSRESISAVASRGLVTYLFRDASQTRVQIEANIASGDSDRTLTSDTVGGNLSGTTDHAFNSLGFANTGLAFAPSLSNIVTVRTGLSTSPLPEVELTRGLQVGADLLQYYKFNERAPIDEPSEDRPFLGVEADLFMNWRLTSDLAFNVRYGAFFPSAAITSTKSVRHFVLVGFTLSF
ncbi:MAG: alginate export family protein [Phycisphaerae bacterium]|nr:alginate export family protein [Phycisphaerae bacterium]